MGEAILELNEIKIASPLYRVGDTPNLAAAHQLINHYGWDDMVFTHLSARVPGPEDHFLLNPYGYQFSEVTASNLVKIDLEGNVVLDNGFEVNAAGLPAHSAVHMARHDAAVVRAHRRGRQHRKHAGGVAAFEPARCSSITTSPITIGRVLRWISMNASGRCGPWQQKRCVAAVWHPGLGEDVSSVFCDCYLERACKIQLGIMSGTPICRTNRPST